MCVCVCQPLYVSFISSLFWITYFLLITFKFIIFLYYFIILIYYLTLLLLF